MLEKIDEQDFSKKFHFFLISRISEAENHFIETNQSCMEEKHQLHHIHVQRHPFIPLEGLFLLIKFKSANLYINKIWFRSLSNLHSQKSRSMKSVKIPWYQKPILHNNKYVNVQRGAMLAALFSFVSCINILLFFQIVWHTITSFFLSFCRFSPLLRQFLIYIACQWRHLDQLIMDTISFHMNLFMLEIVMVIFLACSYLV